MPQTTGCALTHRLPSNTTTAARPPADLPPLPVEEGRGGVRLHTANAKSPAVLLPPPWGRIGVGAVKKRTATKPHQTSSFTYTPSAQAYVKKTIGCALGRVDNSANEPLSLWERGWGEGSNQLKNRNFGPSTTSPPPSPPLPRCGFRPAGEGGYLNCQHALGRVCNLNFPPLRSGGGAGRGCENRVATAFKTKCKQPIAHRLPSNTTTAARPPADLPPPPVGEGRGGVSLHTANAKSPAVLLPPPWGRVGVGAANAKKQPSAHKQHFHPLPVPPPLRASPCRGGRFSPIITARFPPPWPSSHAKYDHIVRGAQRRVGVRLHATNAKSPAVPHPPPWERVGVGAAKKYAATTPTEHPHLHTPRALKRM